MCKHVAAALYGIGARLDQDPMLFFKLRKVNVNELIGKAVTEKTKSLLKKAEKKSGRVMEDADLGELFGIELKDRPDKKTKSEGTLAHDKKSRKTKSQTGIDMVEGLIRKSRKGISLTTLIKKTGFDEKKAYNVLYRIKKLGRIELTGNEKYKSMVDKKD